MVTHLPKQEIQSHLFAYDEYPVVTSFSKHETKSRHVETICLQFIFKAVNLLNNLKISRKKMKVKVLKL